jgi:hypothetical protein
MHELKSSLRWLLRLEVVALSMSGSTLIVGRRALLLKCEAERVRGDVIRSEAMQSKLQKGEK